MRRSLVAPIPIVYDWTCADCGRRGTALALVADDVAERVRLAHFYARRSRPLALPPTPCNPDRLTYQLRGVAP